MNRWSVIACDQFTSDADYWRQVEAIVCEQCGKPIKAIGQFSAEQIANINQKRYGKKLCGECSKKLGEHVEAPKTEEQPAPQEEPKQEEKAE